MESEMKADLKLKEKSHKKNLMLYKLSKAIENFGIRSFALFHNNLDYDLEFRTLIIVVMAAVRFVIRIVPAFVIYALIASIFHIDGKIWIVAIVYILLYLAVLGVGTFLRNKFEDELNLLEHQSQKELDEVFDELCLKNNIERGLTYDKIQFEDLISVNTLGVITAPKKKQSCEFFIYNIKSLADSTAYYAKMAESPLTLQSMEKNIASIEFNKKFSILVNPSLQRECLKYFTPSLQSQMIKSSILDTCCNINFTKENVNATVEESEIERPAKIDLFKWKSIPSYYKDVEEYCETFSKFATKVHKDISKIEF